MAQTSVVLTGKRCRCPTCGESFSVLSNFDRHRVGEYGVDRKCVEPQTVGLVIKTTSSGTYWSMPGPFANK
jgi:hypothetical protein